MIIPPELPDTTKLRKALARYVAITDHDDAIGLSLVLYSLKTFVLIPMSQPIVDGVQRIAFEHVVEDVDMKVVHVYTALEELRPVPDRSLIIPYCFLKLVDEILIPGGFTGLVVDPDAAHSVYIQFTPGGLRVIKPRSLDRRTARQG